LQVTEFIFYPDDLLEQEVNIDTDCLPEVLVSILIAPCTKIHRIRVRSTKPLGEVLPKIKNRDRPLLLVAGFAVIKEVFG
jgi:hypothetical protein